MLKQKQASNHKQQGAPNMIVVTEADDNMSNEDNMAAGLETQDDKRVDSQTNNTGMIPTDNTMITNIPII